jgi:uncharacterized membrane protein
VLLNCGAALSVHVLGLQTGTFPSSFVLGSATGRLEGAFTLRMKPASPKNLLLLDDSLFGGSLTNFVQNVLHKATTDFKSYYHRTLSCLHLTRHFQQLLC